MKQARRERIARWLVRKFMPGYVLLSMAQLYKRVTRGKKNISEGRVVAAKLNDDDVIGGKTVKEIIAETKVPR